jgi:hypothetical protein
MRTLVCILLCSILVDVGLGQRPSMESAGEVWIDRLEIDSQNFPDTDRDRLIHLFQHCTYAQSELQIRIQYALRDALRDMGYYKAVVDDPKVSFVRRQDGRNIADVIVNVDAGMQYRLGEIRFVNATLFPADRMRKLFPLDTGDLFNVSRTLKGLQELQKLYETEGYVNFVAVPELKSDDTRRTIALVIDVDEGKPFNFGRLVLEGIEPHPGAGKALLESWKTLHGKRYNPVVLQRWLLENRSNWPAGTPLKSLTTTAQDDLSRVVNVEFVFP